MRRGKNVTNDIAPRVGKERAGSELLLLTILLFVVSSNNGEKTRISA